MLFRKFGVPAIEYEAPAPAPSPQLQTNLNLAATKAAGLCAIRSLLKEACFLSEKFQHGLSALPGSTVAATEQSTEQSKEQRI